MEKTSNIILICLFTIIAACISLPIFFIHDTFTKICIFIGLIALVALSGFVNHLTYTSENNDDK